jgi:hypothetical protein
MSLFGGYFLSEPYQNSNLHFIFLLNEAHYLLRDSGEADLYWISSFSLHLPGA